MSVDGSAGLSEDSLLDDAAALAAAWDFEAARELLDALVDEVGPHPWEALRLRAMVRRELGDLPGALADAERAADGADARYGAGDPDTVRALAVVGMVRHDLGDWEVAEMLYHQVLDSGVDEDGPAGRAVRLTRANFALLQRDRGDPAMALILLNAAYAVHRREYGPDDLDTVRIAAELADAHLAAGDIPAARRLFAVAHAGASTRLGETHPFTRSIEEELEAVEPVMPALLPISAPPSPSRRRWLRRHPTSQHPDDDESPIGRLPTGPMNTTHPPAWPPASPVAGWARPGQQLPMDRVHQEAPRTDGPVVDDPTGGWSDPGAPQADWPDADGPSDGWSGAEVSRTDRPAVEESRTEWPGAEESWARRLKVDSARVEWPDEGESPRRPGREAAGFYRRRDDVDDTRPGEEASPAESSDEDASLVDWPDEDEGWSGQESTEAGWSGSSRARLADDPSRVEWPDEDQPSDDGPSRAGWSTEEPAPAPDPSRAGWSEQESAAGPSRAEWSAGEFAPVGDRSEAEWSAGEFAPAGDRSEAEWSASESPPAREASPAGWSSEDPSQAEWSSGETSQGGWSSEEQEGFRRPVDDSPRAERSPVDVPSAEWASAEWPVEEPARSRGRSTAERPPVDLSRDEDWASGEWPVETPVGDQEWAAQPPSQQGSATWPPEEQVVDEWSPVDRPRPASGWSDAASTVDQLSTVDVPVGSGEGWWGPGVKPASPVPWQKLLIFGLSALVAVVVGVVAIFLVSPGRRGVQPSAVASSAVTVPLDVRLVDGGESLTVMWAAQPTDVVVALTGAGSAPTVLAQLPPGATSYVVRGVDRTAQYCVVVGTVVDGAPLSAATSVCTRR